MDLKCLIRQFFQPNQLVLLHFLSILFALILFTATADQTTLNNNNNNNANQTDEIKAKLLKMIQKETFQLNGFDEFATIPITYPLDICLMEVNNNLYAVCLALDRSQNETKTLLKVLRKVHEDPNNPLFDYVEVFSYETHSAQNLDCKSMGTEGYIAVVNELNRHHASHHSNETDGSPIFQLKNDKVVAVQYFTRPHQRRVHFFKYHSELLMWQSFQTHDKLANETTYCPLMKWFDTTFSEIDQIPCTNAMQIESFVMDSRIYVAVANYMDEHENIETHSTIYQYDMKEHTFSLIQNIKTFGAIDIKHVHLDENHFLIIANSMRPFGSTHNQTIESNVIVYLYDHEHSKFVPVQILSFDDEVTQLLPYMGENNEFALMISMEEGTTEMYEYDGFQFFPTPVTFTGGSLGRGVSKMRTFKMNNEFLVLVVANSEMYRDAPNLYRFKFTRVLDYDFSKAFELFDQWYAGVQEKLKNDRIEEISHKIQNLKPPPGFGVFNIEETTIDTIYTETISSTSIPIDFVRLKKSIQRAQEILSKENVRRPKRLNDSMLQNDMNSSRSDDDLSDFMEIDGDTLTIDELTIGDSFYAERINGRSVADLLQSDLDELSLDTMTVGKLIIANNSENFDEIEKKLLDHDKRVKRDIAPEDQPLIFDDITVHGLVNGIDFNKFVEQALRTDVDHQVLQGPVRINRLQAESLETIDGKISGLDLSNIGHTEVKELVIRQPILFEKGITVDRLKTLQSLNEIKIVDGKMDALFKRSKHVQEIRGQKTFESINLLEPITLRGKINISSPLNKIKPIVTIDEDIELVGDFEFVGNVTVQNYLQAQNMFGKSTRYSVQQVFDDGLRLDEQEVDVPLQFLQPIQIDNVELGTRINDIPIESLILRNVSEWQEIIAPKHFTSDLSVVGDCEIIEINGVNIQQFNDTVLKKTNESQIVTGTIQFARITAKNVNADRMFFGKTPIERLLTTDTEQIINANVTIRGNILLANDSAMEINQLTMNGRIFGVDVPELIEDSYIYSPNQSISITSFKHFENVTIDRLVIEEGGDFWQTGQTIGEIEKLLSDLNSDYRIEGPITFDSQQFSIDNLTVTDAINDIPSASFGKEWLLFNGSQIFTVPQNFTDVTFNDNIQLYGLLNGFDLPALVADSVSVNEPALLPYVIFDNVIFKKSLTIGGTLSGIRIPDDLILRQSDSLQNFNEPLTFASDVTIHGTLTIADKLNGFNLRKMCELLEPQSDTPPQKLTIKGNVIFNTSPTIEYLNSEPFEHLRLTTWMATDQYVNFTSDVQFENVIFEKSITTTGPVNGFDLQSLNDRYLSLSKPQNVTTPLRFRGRLGFRDTLTVDTISLDGLIKVPNSDITLNITDFDQNVLKTTNSTQFIRGPWQFNEIRFLGDLSSTTINGLNFASDIVRWSSPTNIIRAPKRFHSLSIDRLDCQFGCTMQGIDMADWISKAVLTTSNQTIQGTVYARNAVISYVEVLGLVNNMTFNSENILLKSVPQQLYGTLTIGNDNFDANSMTSLTFDNLDVNSINDQNVSEFFANVIQRSEDGSIDVGELYTDLEFTDRLDVDNLIVTNQSNYTTPSN